MNINKDNSIKSKIKISCNKQEPKLLVDSYFDIPYKLVHYGSSQRTNHLEVIQMCSSPGVMDGDSLDMEVICGRIQSLSSLRNRSIKYIQCLRVKELNNF